MCETCVDLLGFQLCPPRLAVREPDFADDLAFEREVQSLLGERRPQEIDATTGLVLRAGLLPQCKESSTRPRTPRAES